MSRRHVCERMTEKRANGFSLLELMIVVAIVAILAAIAIPSYTQYMQRARRADARVALLQAVSSAEKYFLDTGAYFEAVSPGSAGLSAMKIPADSESGYYKIRYAFDKAAGISATNPLFEAVAVSTQAQYADTNCRTFQIGISGQQAAISADGTDTTSSCW